MTRTSSTARTGAKPARSWRRRAVRLALVAVAGFALIAFVGTRSFVLRRLIEPRLAAMLGADARCATASLTLSADLALRGVTLRAPGVDGEAGRFFHAPRAVVDLAWRDLLFGGGSAIRALTIESPTFRLSVGAGQRVNLASVGVSGTGSGASLRPPAIEVRKGRIEFGEHDDAGDFTLLASLDAGGSLTPASGDGVYELSLREEASGGGGSVGAANQLRVDGVMDLNTLEGQLTLRDLDLSRWGVEAAPSEARDLLRGLTIDGRVQEGLFSYAEADGLAALLRVEGVNVGLPVPVEANDFVTSEPVAIRLLRTRSVTGTIRIDKAGLFADLEGEVEGIPGRVLLSTRGLDLSAPLTCDIAIDEYALDRAPGILTFAPRHIRATFENFSNPKGSVSGTVRLTRSEPVEGRAAPILASGRLEVRDGWAMRSAFPYPVRELSGVIEFDNEQVQLLDLQGVGPTGADVVARGVIAPLGRWAGVDVVVEAASAPIDEALLDALKDRSRAAVEALLDEQALARLRDSGALEGAPEFSLGGEGVMRIRVTRAAGAGERYRTEVEATYPRVGLVPRVFPHPLIAEDLRLHVEPELITVESDRLLGLVGGAGTLRASVVTRDDEGERVFLPAIDIAMRDAPVSELLLRALPPAGVEPAGDAGADAGAWSAERIVRALGVAGVFDLSLRIEPDDAGRLGYEASVAFDDLRAAPAGEAEAASGLAGEIHLTNDGLTLRSGRGELAGAPLTFDVDAAYPRDAERSLRAQVRAEYLPLEATLDGWAGLASPEAAAQLRSLRVDRRLSGRADVVVDVAQARSEPAQVQATAEHIRDAELDLLGGRLTAERFAGAIAATPAGVEFRELAGAVSFNDEAFGEVWLDGQASLASLLAGDAQAGAGALKLRVQGGAIESRLTAAALEAASGAQAALALEALGASGRFDADLTLGGVVQGEIRPTALALARNGAEITFTEVAGAIALGEEGVHIAGAELVTPDWRISFDGAVQDGEAAGRALTGTLTAEGARLNDALLALLPANVAGALRAVSLEVEGSFRLAEAQARLPVDEPDRASLTGTLAFDGASANLGAAIEAARGLAHIRLDPVADLDASTEARESLRLELTLERFSAGGVQMRSGGATVARDEAGVITVRNATAHVHGGKASVEATLTPAPMGSGEPTMLYDASLRLHDVDLALALADWTGGADDVEQALGSRGRLRGGVFVAGSLAAPASKFGRGEVEVQGGEVLRLPLLMPIIELSNLSAPRGESLERAWASFFIEGDAIRLERIEAESESILVVGAGSATWPGLELDLRFNTQRKRRLGLLSDLLEGLRDEIVTARVQGTLREPRVGVEQLPATRRMLEDLFGGGERERRTGSGAAANAGSGRGGTDHP